VQPDWQCGRFVLTSGGGPEYVVVFVSGDGTTTRVSVSQEDFRDVGPKASAAGGCGSITLISDLDAFTQGRGAVPLSVRWQD
jgi:hypothetical protein